MKHFNKLKQAYELLADNETKACGVIMYNLNGQDIFANVMQGLILTRYLLDKTSDLEQINQIIEQQKVVRNKIRLAMFAYDISNVELNKLVNGNFINYT